MRALAGFFAFIFFVALLIAGGALYVKLELEKPGPLDAPVTIIISRGSGAANISRQLQAEHVVSNPWLFRLQHYLDKKPSLKAGEYAFAPHETLATIVSRLAKGDVVIRKFTVPEGLTSGDIVHLLQADQALTGDIGVPPEGSLMPDTYRYTYGDSRQSLIVQMQKEMTEAVTAAFAGRDPEVPVTDINQLVTLASIIEKETGVAAERPRVAGVFANRLKAKMPLQSDPTVTYGITLGGAPLGRALMTGDLQRPTPYNTYTIAALPPGPIANPGRAALQAAAHPEKNNFLYFVADGTGGHAFAATLAEHNANVAKWRELNKKP